MSNDKLLNVSNDYMLNCGINDRDKLLKRRGVVDCRTLANQTNWKQSIPITDIA